jgi:hypothetical protein
MRIRHILAALLALLPFTAHADVVVETGFVSSPDWGGDWFGTFTGVPPSAASQTISVAQQFVSPGNFANLSLTVQLGDVDAAIVNFSLVADNNGSPGVVIESDAVDIGPEPAGVLDDYALDFPGVTLASGTAYWIVASSPTVEPFEQDVQLPIWALSPCGQLIAMGFSSSGCSQAAVFPFAAMDSLEGSSWMLNSGGESFAFEMDGTDPVLVPEPRWVIASVLVMGFLGCALWSVLRGTGLAARRRVVVRDSEETCR